MVKKLVAVVLAGALLVGSVGEAFAAKPHHAGPVKATGATVWQVFGGANGTWD
jgi:hypothetical protein